jgi:hypothetical protein
MRTSVVRAATQHRMDGEDENRRDAMELLHCGVSGRNFTSYSLIFTVCVKTVNSSFRVVVARIFGKLRGRLSRTNSRRRKLTIKFP